MESSNIAHGVDRVTYGMVIYIFLKISGNSYLNMVRKPVIPELENSQLFKDIEIISRQNDASPHYANVEYPFKRINNKMLSF